MLICDTSALNPDIGCYFCKSEKSIFKVKELYFNTVHLHFYANMKDFQENCHLNVTYKQNLAQIIY